jgi:hypothetical protein
MAGDGEPRIFTEYVRSLDARGEAPSAESFVALWEALRSALRSELRKRGLWESPPSYLGIYGWQTWEEGPEEVPEGAGALEELAAECYSFIFVLRLRSLRAQLKVKENVDGLVFLNIRHFLHERQKEHDPLGFRVFEILRLAVRQAVAAGELHVLAGDERIRNETVLGFAGEPGSRAPSADDPRAVVARWNDELLPDLVTARGAQQDEVVERLRRRLAELGGEKESFRFKELVDALKNDVRTRWAALLDHSEGETAAERTGDEPARLIRIVRPSKEVEERQSFERLTGCMASSLARLALDARSRHHLFTLWQFVRVEASGAAGGPELDGGGEKLLSQRKLAELLRIPRDRLPGLFATLRRLLEDCQAANQRQDRL